MLDLRKCLKDIEGYLIENLNLSFKDKRYVLFQSNIRFEPQGDFYLPDQPFVELTWLNKELNRKLEVAVYVKPDLDKFTCVPFFRIKNGENETLRFEDYYKNKYGKDLPVKYFAIHTIEQVSRLKEFLSLVLSELENGLSKIVDGEQWYATKFDWGPYK